MSVKTLGADGVQHNPGPHQKPVSHLGSSWTRWQGLKCHLPAAQFLLCLNTCPHPTFSLSTAQGTNNAHTPASSPTPARPLSWWASLALAGLTSTQFCHGQAVLGLGPTITSSGALGQQGTHKVTHVINNNLPLRYLFLSLTTAIVSFKWWH